MKRFFFILILLIFFIFNNCLFFNNLNNKKLIIQELKIKIPASKEYYYYKYYPSDDLLYHQVYIKILSSQELYLILLNDIKNKYEQLDYYAIIELKNEIELPFAWIDISNLTKDNIFSFQYSSIGKLYITFYANYIYIKIDNPVVEEGTSGPW